MVSFLPPFQPAAGKGRKTEPGRVIEPRIRRKVARGHIAIDGVIDLHGMRHDEARSALARFIEMRVMRGDRTVLVITGKGQSSSGDFHLAERGVLRTMLPRWLSEPQLAPLVAGWDRAAQGHGGDGAFYVRLRRLDRGDRS